MIFKNKNIIIIQIMNRVAITGIYIINIIYWLVIIINNFQAYFVSLEQNYEAKFQNILNKYAEMLLKIQDLENRIIELELKNSIEQLKEEPETISNIAISEENLDKNLDKNIGENKELIEMLKEDKQQENIENKSDNELVDLSEETYPVKNPNKKSWIKTLFFM
jgi:hypothetical protein